MKDLPQTRFYTWLLGAPPKEWTHRYSTFVDTALGIELDTRTLAHARASFHTAAHHGRPTQFDGKPAPPPPPQLTKLDVKGPQGRLAAYVIPIQKMARSIPR